MKFKLRLQNLNNVRKQYIILKFLLLLCFNCLGQLPTKSLYIDISELKNVPTETLADGSNIYTIENVDSNFKTSIALLRYLRQTELIGKRVIKNGKINYDQLLQLIKKNKNEFTKDHSLYLIEKRKKRSYFVYKVFDVSYVESMKSIDDPDILEHFF